MNIEIAVLGDPGAPLARRHPLAKLGAAALLMLALFLAVDLVTSLVLLALLVAAVPFSGLRPVTLLRRAWPLLVAGLAIAVLNTVFAPHQVSITTGAFTPAGPLWICSPVMVTGEGNR